MIILLMIKTFKNIVIIILIILTCLLIISAYLEWKEDYLAHKQQEKHIREQRENKENIIQAFLDNKNIFDDLVQKIYSREDNINVKFTDGNVQFFVDNKEEKINDEFSELLNRIHAALECNRISLYINSSDNKILEIYIGSKGLHVESIISRR